MFGAFSPPRRFLSCWLPLLTARARFVAPAIAQKYDFDVPAYEGLDQIVEVGSGGLKL